MRHNRRIDLLKAFVQLTLLAHHSALLLLALLKEFFFKLLDLQLQRFAAAVEGGFTGHHFAGDGLQAPRRFFADACKAFLGGHQLLLHHRQLLKTPPRQPGKRQQDRAEQCPQRASGGRLDLDHRGVARIHRGAFSGTGWGGQFIVVIDRGSQGRDIIEVVAGIVTHGKPYSKPE